MSTTNGSDDSLLLPMASLLANKHILLLHAGGDSKRVPWANPMGKVFLPLPYLASDEPDGPVPLLFDHILAIASCARQAFGDQGYFLHICIHSSQCILFPFHMLALQDIQVISIKFYSPPLLLVVCIHI